MSKPSMDTQFLSHRYDRVLLAIVFGLIGFGLVMVYSASVVSAEHQFGDGAYYLKRQLVFLGLGLCGMVGFLLIPHQILERYAAVCLLIAVLLLVLVLIPGLSSSAKGASRWLNLGVVRLQPSEFVKFGFLLFMAQYLSRRQLDLDKLKVAWGVPTLVLAVIAALLMKQPDFGSTVLCGAMMFLMIFAAGGALRHIMVFSCIGLGLIVLAVTTQAYRMKRVLTFLNPDSDPLGAGYQINQALISFGSGEWFGVGLGESRQKLMYLPDAHTDFIFSIVGEELGLLGAACLLVGFIALIWRGIRIARNASTAFGALLAFGVTGLIALQACINMAVVMALLPTKGLTLPFISYGGSSVIVLCTSVGVLLNVSRQTPPPGWLHAERPLLSKLDQLESWLQIRLGTKSLAP